MSLFHSTNTLHIIAIAEEDSEAHIIPIGTVIQVVPSSGDDFWNSFSTLSDD